MPARRIAIVLPDLGLGTEEVLASVWLTPLGSQVVCGDRVLEIVSGAVTVDLPAPATGRLAEQHVAEDDVLHTGQTLGVIEEE
jgi:pyruvate/2-oxoglutarate dehydrogenase complex dihydrolipoamide acyltransferase (E2) component